MAYAGVTRAYLQKKDTVNAYAAAANAQELAPGDADTKVALGEIYFRQGKLGESESQFIAVVNSGANKAAAYLSLARVSRAISYYARERRLLAFC